MEERQAESLWLLHMFESWVLARRGVRGRSPLSFVLVRGQCPPFAVLLRRTTASVTQVPSYTVQIGKGRVLVSIELY
jgi:hypothetical protein